MGLRSLSPFFQMKLSGNCLFLLRKCINLIWISWVKVQYTPTQESSISTSVCALIYLRVDGFQMIRTQNCCIRPLHQSHSYLDAKRNAVHKTKHRYQAFNVHMFWNDLYWFCKEIQKMSNSRVLTIERPFRTTIFARSAVQLTWNCSVNDTYVCLCW